MSEIKRWYYRRNGTEHGPISGNELKRLALSGEVQRDDEIRQDGMDRWVSALKVKGLFEIASDQQARAPAGPSKPVDVSQGIPVRKQVLQPERTAKPEATGQASASTAEGAAPSSTNSSARRWVAMTAVVAISIVAAAGWWLVKKFPTAFSDLATADRPSVSTSLTDDREQPKSNEPITATDGATTTALSGEPVPPAMPQSHLAVPNFDFIPPQDDPELERQFKELIKAEQSTELDRPPTVPISKFVGSWKGVFYSWPDLLEATIEIRQLEGTNKLEGEAIVQSVDAKQREKLNMKASYTVTGEYQALTHSFIINAKVSQGYNLGIFPLVGVYEPQSDRLAGICGKDIPSTPYFVCVRGEDGATLASRVEKIAYTPGKSVPASTPIDPSLVRRVEEWESKIKEEYPDIDPRHPDAIGIDHLARNLCSDEYFKACFGCTYDNLDPDLRSLAGSITGVNRGGIFVPLRDYQYLSRSFITRGEYTAADITVSVLAQRATRLWLPECEKDISDVPTRINTFSLIKLMEANAAPQLEMLWPSEQAKFASVVLDTRQKLALPVLTLSADKFIGIAKGYGGAKALANWETKYKNTLEYLPEENKSKLQARFESREDELLKELLAKDSLSIDSLGHGLEAVVGELNLYRKINSLYGFAQSRAPIQEVLQKIAKRRPADLDEAIPEMKKLLAAQTTAGAISQTFQTYLRLPGDRSTSAGKQLGEFAFAQEVTAHQADVAQAEQAKEKAREAMFSPFEHKCMDASGRIVSPAAIETPTPEEIRLAFLRAVDAVGGQMIDSHTAHYTIPPFGSPPLDRFKVYIILTIGDVDINPDGKHPPVKDGDGYNVWYRLHPHAEWSTGWHQFMNSGGALGGKVMDMIMTVLNATSPVVQDHFEFGLRGWYSPTIQSRGLTGIADFYGNIGKQITNSDEGGM